MKKIVAPVRSLLVHGLLAVLVWVFPFQALAAAPIHPAYSPTTIHSVVTANHPTTIEFSAVDSGNTLGNATVATATRAANTLAHLTGFSTVHPAEVTRLGFQWPDCFEQSIGKLYVHRGFALCARPL